ncbi:hypothetical protein O1W68_18720 [Rhodococcus sp. H36-A4]|uniref:hypothetical protein n=1 Tax=Rhodococcus sp. H36-A4 TaxID=3004353 RepID=UPI0022B06462|nr:hypothetical protein [Rhodococcus sp. H36-A4]MCZ4079984.1 hypothetical protein [Rhodococcus sp. H36-A4]
MATDKQARRSTALTQWAQAAASVGFGVPTARDIQTISSDPDGWSKSGVSPAASDWADTITHINHQIKFGMDPLEVLRHLPEELRTPRSGPAKPTIATSSSTSPDVEKPTPKAPDTKAGERTPIDALLAWRADRIAAGDTAAASIKDVTFHNLIKYGHTSATQIRKQLRGPSVSLAGSIAEVFSNAGAKDTKAEAEVPSAVAPVEESTRVDPAPTFVVPPGTARHGRKDEPQASTPSPALPNKSEFSGLESSDFCEYNFESTFQPEPLKVSNAGDGRRLSWSPHPDADGSIAIYRVISGEINAPYKPEAGELLGVTSLTTWVDDRPPTSAVRNYQVWCHRGHDAADATMQQPDKIAYGEAVSPVTGFELTEDVGRVIGRWSAFQGTRAVRIYRIPLDGMSPVSNDPRYQIEQHADNLTGFVDEDVVRGQRYLYRAISEVSVADGVRQAAPSQGEILVSVVLEPVEDLTVHPDPDPNKPSFELVWTTPESGHVLVYRTETPPDAGLRFAVLAEGAIEVEGLSRQTQLAQPIEAGEGGTSRMRRIPWPAGWDRAYLTPVTLLNGSARVGKTTVQTRPISPVTDARIVERCANQLVTFGWPKAAASVYAYYGPRNHVPENLLESQPNLEISATQYKRDGGLSFKRLPPGGCSVHLVPIAYSRGERVAGTVTTLDYKGLASIWYLLNRIVTPNGGTRLEITMGADGDLEPPAPFTLVYNHERLPLSARDGEALLLSDQNDHSGREMRQFLPPRLVPQWTPTGWSADATNRRGYVRLFLDIDSARAKSYALLDPPVAQLLLEPDARPDR